MSKLSVEEIKEQSGGLRGTIVDTLASDVTHFAEEDLQLLKFHGTYQQDDRDLRAERKKAGLDKAFSFMVRSKIPGGDLTPEQYLAHDHMADDLGNSTLRITTREGFQIHGVIKGSLKDCIARIQHAGLTTWGACGDVVRNTVGPASPRDTVAHRDALELSRELSKTFLARSSAYIDIWLDGEKVDLGRPSSDGDEPIYGKHYLPRKFKIGIAIQPQNDVDIYSQDLGFVPHLVDGAVEGYTVLVGGGFGMTHGMAKTYPRLADPLFYIRREHAIATAIAVVTVQRDFGDRSDRKHARMKYLIEERGIAWFRTQVCERLQAPTEPAKTLQWQTVSDEFGWQEQGDGRLFCGIYVPQGRIQDTDQAQYRTAFRKIATEFGLPARLTANCNLLFYNVQPERQASVDQILDAHRIPRERTLTRSRLMSHACVALPTCGLSLAESERVFGDVMDGIDAVLREFKLEHEEILFRMTGCPNGCARPYNADFAFVGRAPGKYAMYVGGSSRGDRLAGLHRKVVAEQEIPSAVRLILEEFVAGRTDGESFTDFWGRTQVNGDRPHPDQFHVELSERAARIAATKALA